MRPTLDELAARLARGEAVVAGVLSGTSADGIDVALARLPAGRRPRLLAFDTLPFEAELRARLRAALDGNDPGLRGTALLHRDLGIAFGEAVRALARRAGLAVELVGSHGQTVYHHDGSEPSGPATLQLGDGDFVAARSGAHVVSDFRQADVAAGGEGAPLSALADAALFPELPRPSAILNLGGIGNLTLLPAEGGRLLAFDTGPAGSLLDGLARRFLGAELDEDGRFAAAGRPVDALVERLGRHPFLDRPPPRSTGRDTFGERWLEGVLAEADALGLLAQERLPDLFASAVRFVARAATDALERFADPAPRVLVVTGGGARHPGLVAELRARSGLVPRRGEDEGVPGDAREALVFAWLASRWVAGEPASDPGATGAAPGAFPGKLSRPPLAAPGGVL